MAEGAVHEVLNMAALWRLPLILVCENNGWSEFSPTERQFKGTLGGLASAFNIQYRHVDGNDVEEVSVAAREIRTSLQDTAPFVLECRTVRVRGHFEGDAQKYRRANEIASLDACDPIRRSCARLIELGVPEDQLNEVALEVDTEVASAIEAARKDAMPVFELAYADVYTPSADQVHG
jgi:pyruvate dehydrogenase E1 component alpha subunit